MLGIFLDIETTGLDFMRHRPIDLALEVIDLTEGLHLQKYQAIIKQPEEQWHLSDPDSLAINGYTWEEVSQGKEPSNVAAEIISLLSELKIEREKSVFICQNPAFDRGFFSQLIDVYTQEKLRWPYHWLDFASMYWAFVAEKSSREGTPFPKELNLSKNKIAARFDLPEEQTPHRAETGVTHLLTCYQRIFATTFH